MAQSWTQKQGNFLQRLQPAVVQLLSAVDVLQALASEYSQDAYGTGGANAIVDATVQALIPSATAANVGQAVGIIDGANQLLSVVGQGTTGRAYLELMRP